MMFRYLLPWLLVLAPACSDDAPPPPAPRTAEPEDTAPLSWSMSTTEPSARPSKRRPLGLIASTAKTVHVTVIPSLDAPEKTQTADIEDKEEVKAVLDALGRDKTATDAAPRCVAPTEIELRGPTANKLAVIAVCQLGGVEPSEHGIGRMLEPDSDAGGWKVQDLEALKKVLKKAGAPIP